MVRLAWIALELGSAPGFPKKKIIPQKPQPDDGPGVPESSLDDLFRPFFRLDESRERSTGGVGLGLAIAQRAVKLHGGEIKVRNRTGGGLEVVIRFPVASSSAVLLQTS